MADRTLFLSHIHEERELASIFKQELESEFSGFVEVFVSSDGISIPAGANFLRKIEDGLVECIGALYLISPISVKRNWINFELGAVWIRSAIAVRGGKPEIPTLPLCHSGSLPATLPAPLNNLNAVTANQSSQLELAFRSLQNAVGGHGNLKSDFDKLAAKVADFERIYTRGNHLREMFRWIGGDPGPVVDFARQKLSQPNIDIKLGFIPAELIERLKSYEANELNGIVTVELENPGLSFSPTAGAINGAQVTIKIPPQIIIEFQKLIVTI